MGFSGFHLLVVVAIVLVPLLAAGGIVALIVLLVRSTRPAREERIAQRTAELLRGRD